MPASLTMQELFHEYTGHFQHGNKFLSTTITIIAILPSILSFFAVLYILSTRYQARILSLFDDLSVFLTPKEVRFFHEGIGDEEVFVSAQKVLAEQAGYGTESVPEVTILSWTKEAKISFAKAEFISPLAHLLPAHKNVTKVNIQIVIPSSMTFKEAIQKGIPFAIHLPATGDEGFDLRRKYLGTPLIEHYGIASIILQLPFYGERRLPSQQSYALPSIQTAAQQGAAAIKETHAIVRWLREALLFRGKIALTGISFGGSMAALSSVWLQNFPHAVVSHVPANSPSDGFIHGAFSKAVHWPSFPQGKEKETVHKYLSGLNVCDTISTSMKNNSCPGDRSNAAESLNGTSLGSESSRSVTCYHPRRVYFQLSATHDKYIPFSSAKQLFEKMSSLPNLQAKHFAVLNGGHASSIYLERHQYLQLIAQALELLEQ